MDSPDAVTPRPPGLSRCAAAFAAWRACRRPWPSLWATVLVSLVAQLALCQFFSFGQRVPSTIDVNPCNLWKYAYQFPPRGEFLVLNWLGVPNLPPPLNPFGLAAAHFSTWLFFTAYAPLIATGALLAMAAFLRELDLSRPAALFGGVIYAWQGDLLPFVFPGHYAYITTWPFFALAAWAALRARRHWAYALIAGANCGLVVGLQQDRGGIACLLIAVFYLAPACLGRAPWIAQIRPLVLCVVTALLISFAAFLALFQSNIIGVKLGGAANREQAFTVATQYSLSPADTITYLVPGFFGWYNGNENGPYWGLIGQTPGWDQTHQGMRNQNLAISTTGTAATILALLGACLLLPGTNRYFGSPGAAATRAGHWTTSASNPAITAPGETFPRAPAEEQAAPLSRSGPEEITPTFTDRQIVFGRTLLILGAVSLVLAWGYHTPFYRALFALPLMDKWRNPLKWLEIFNFAAVVLAAFGAQHLVRSLVEEKLRHALVLFFAVASSILFILLLASYGFAIVVAASLSDGGGYDATGIANVMHTLHVSLGFALLIGVLLWLALAGAWRGDRLQQWQIVNPWLRHLWFRALSAGNRAATLAVCLAALAALQLDWVAGKFLKDPLAAEGNPDLAQIAPTNPLLQSLRAEGPTVRVAVPAPQPPMLNSFLQYQFAADRISSIDISAASRIPDALSAFVSAFNGHPARFWLLGGVKNVAIAEQDLATLRQDPEVAANIAKADGYTLAPAPDGQPSHVLVRLRDWFAKATFIRGAEIIPHDEDQLKRLADPKWNPGATVLLHARARAADESGGAAPLIPQPRPGSTPLDMAIAFTKSVPVTVTRYTPHAIDLAVNTPASGYVLINDEYDPDWQAEVNGQPAPLLRADYLLRAVAVGPGASTIKLRYVAHYRVAGLSLPVVATNECCDATLLLAWLIAGIALWRDRRKPTPL